MNPAKHNLDEVVFANRNQAYGAYAIRKQYPANVNRSLIIVLSSLTLLPVVGYLKAPRYHKSPFPIQIDKDKTVTIVDIILEPIQQAASAVASSAGSASTTNSMNYRITPDQLIRKQPVVSTVVTSPVSQPTSVIGDGKDLNKSNILGSLPGPLTNPILPAKPDVREVADVMPMFNDGNDDLYAYLGKMMNYPELARKLSKEGKVVVMFEVDENGRVRNVQIEKSLGFGCDDEAIRVISNMPKWKPGIYQGNPVSVRMRLPITFKLD